MIQEVIAAILVEPPRIASPKEGADQPARMMTLDVGAKLVEYGRDLDRMRIAVKTIESDDDQLLGRRLPRRVATVKTVEEIDQNAAVPILQRVKVLARISDITLYIVLQRRLGISTWPTRLLILLVDRTQGQFRHDRFLYYEIRFQSIRLREINTTLGIVARVVVGVVQTARYQRWTVWQGVVGIVRFLAALVRLTPGVNLFQRASHIIRYTRRVRARAGIRLLDNHGAVGQGQIQMEGKITADFKILQA